MKTSFIILFMLFSVISRGQNLNENVYENYIPIEKEETQETEDEIPPELQLLIDKQIDLNSEDAIVLLQQNLITQKQYEALLSHRRTYGELIAIEELQVITEFDKTTIASILPYIKVTGKSAVNGESHTLTFRFQQQVKDQTPADFQGDPTKFLLKYRGEPSKTISCGLLAEKDPGEKVIFGAGKAGFDFYSFFVKIKMKGKIESIILGDYAVSFGQGLTTWTSGGFTSKDNLISMCRSGRGIYPTTSTDENRFLRGLGITGKINEWKWSTWFSMHKIDANLETDSTGDSKYIRSLLTSGYHRDQSEESGYHVARETFAGINFNGQINKFKIGLSGSFLHYSEPYLKTQQEYNKYEFRGSDLANLGIDYSRNYKNMLFFGEFTTCNNFTVAYLNGVLISAGKNASLSVVHHSYPRSFHSLKSNALGSNTLPANENGIYFGVNLKIASPYSISGYVNYDEFPYLKFRSDLPSSTLSKGISFNYSPSKKFTTNLKTKVRSYQINTSDASSLIEQSTITITNYRISTSVIVDEYWDYRTKIEIGIKNLTNKETANGYELNQDIFFHPPKKKYTINFRYAIYNVPDFDLRFYEYENDLPGAFSVPFYYGIGSRAYVNFSYKIKRATISLKLARSWVNPNETYSEYLSIIDDIKMQIKLSL